MTSVPVVLFHGVDDDGGAWSVSWKRFAELVDKVAASGRTPITLGQLAARISQGASLDALVVVSFDDGEANQLPAAEHLAAAGIPSTVYVTVDHVGRDGMLDLAQLRDLGAVTGIEVGSHAVHHEHLDVLRPADLVRNLVDSRRFLEDELGRVVDGVAYPHGSHDARVVRAAREAGYTSGAAVRNALSHEGEHPLSLSRLTVQEDTPDAVVEEFLLGQGRLGEVRQRLRTRGFRHYRRLRHRLARGPLSPGSR